jgi:hypothetical protein
MKLVLTVSIVVAILGSNPSFASAKLRGNANDDGDVDLVLEGNSGSAGQPPSVKG